MKKPHCGSQCGQNHVQILAFLRRHYPDQVRGFKRLLISAVFTAPLGIVGFIIACHAEFVKNPNLTAQRPMSPAAPCRGGRPCPPVPAAADRLPLRRCLRSRRMRVREQFQRIVATAYLPPHLVGADAPVRPLLPASSAPVGADDSVRPSPPQRIAFPSGEGVCEADG